MYKWLFFIFLSLLHSSVFGQSSSILNSSINKKFNASIKESILKNNSLICYKNSSQFQVEVTKKSETDIRINIDNNKYNLKLVNRKIKLSLNGKFLKNIKVKPDISFINKISLGKEDELSKYVSCYISHTLYEHKELGEQLLMDVHGQTEFYGDSKDYTHWYNRYLNSHEGFFSILSVKQSYLAKSNNVEPIQKLKELNSQSDFYSNLESSTKKLSPIGLLHLKFENKHFTKVRIMGGMYNYCITNMLFSIARAQVDASISEIQVELPAYYVSLQELGLNKSLSMKFSKTSGNSLFINLGTLFNDYPDAFHKIFQGQKSYIEDLLNGEVEVLLRDDVAKTDKPTLRLSILFK